MRLHRDDEGLWWLSVPAQPGCFTQGQSVDEVLARASEAIEGHLAALLDVGEPAPEDGAVLMGEVQVTVRAG
ncbi:MAG: type II toxin-antitoxin system HicB family antitoxin [Thermaerobacter sp.]|nr:type II toxin-antitoxin system HicB family antitoxin [Thermaerobacter sp.]